MMITSTNPTVYTDFPDPDIIRVGDVYYMATTTMHFTPGCDILRSYDLVHWEFIAHALNIVADTPEERLECEGANAYGRGMWAPSLRYHRGTWYVLFAATDTHTSYLLTADDPCGPWRKRELDGFYHDSGLFFDDDDRAYVVYGQSTLRITELNPELSGPMPGGLDRVIAQDDPQADLGYEGSHLYKHDGRYYVFTCHFPQGKGKTEACLIAESLDGAFEAREIIDDDLSFHGYGVAQGGMVDTPDGDWYAFMMQDRGGVGRVPTLMPMRFGEDGFPVIGENGKVPQSVSVPAASCAEPVAPINGSEFIARHNAEGGVDANCLQPYWQFNHITHDEYWSLTERPGYYRIWTRDGQLNEIRAKNTLLRREQELSYVVETKLEFYPDKDGEQAGLTCYYSTATYARCSLCYEGGRKIQLVINRNHGEELVAEVDHVKEGALYLKVVVEKLTRTFYYSYDGENWEQVGVLENCIYLCDEGVPDDPKRHTGTLVGIYANNGGCGSRKAADFDYFKYED